MSFCNLRMLIAAVAFSMPMSIHAQDAQQITTVDELIKSMTDTLKDAESISVHVEKSFDDVLVTGIKLQYSGAMDIDLRRPDRFHIDYGDDLSSKEAWYDGSHLVLVDYLASVYGQLPAESTIDATLDAVEQAYGLRLPMAGLLSSDAYEVFREKADKMVYVGLHDVDGTLAHHVLITGPYTNWQIWIDAEEAPLPLKIVVTELDEPGEPQSVFLFEDWNLAADLPDDLFVPQIPNGAALATFLPGG